MRGDAVSIHAERLKILILTIDGIAFDCQVSTFNMNPNAKVGNQQYTYCSAGEGNNSFYEETDDQYGLELKLFSDWRVNGISDYLMSHNKDTAAFVLDHHEDLSDQHVRWAGNLIVLAPSVGGDTRTTETQDITLPVIGIPAYDRV
jgi:hypothetical protein